MQLERGRRPRSTTSLLLIMLAALLLLCATVITVHRGGRPDAVLYTFILAGFAALRASRVSKEMAIVASFASESGQLSRRWLASRADSSLRRLGTWAVPPLVVLLLMLVHRGWMPLWFWLVCLAYLVLEICLGLLLENRYRRYRPE